MYSLTKYMGGHSDTVMGALVVNDDELHERLAFYQNSCGGTPGPQDCFLVLRGLKTLHVRMQRHCENGRKVAEYLESHPKVEKVFWPGLPNHPNHAIAAKQMNDFGGMLSFVLKGDRQEDAIAVLEKFELLHAGRKPGRRGKPLGPPRHHDARQHSGRAAPQIRPLRLAHPPERGH